MKKVGRYAFIAFLKFVAIFYGLFAVYKYILPESVTGTALNIVTWIAVFFISYAFATWAFHPSPPTDRDTATLAIVWMAVTIVLLLGYGLLFTFRGPRILFETEVLVQLVIELIAVILAGYISRRRRLKQELGEGDIEIRSVV